MEERSTNSLKRESTRQYTHKSTFMDISSALHATMEETIETIAAMRSQEDTGYVTSDWLQLQQSEPQMDVSSKGPLHRAAVDIDCRNKMSAWCFQVVDSCKLRHETVEIAMSCLDRFVATAEGKEARHDRSVYRVACMAALYTAIKINEPRSIDPTIFSKLSHGTYSPQDIVAMEAKLLQGLKWRVNPPTSMAFASRMLDLIPEDSLAKDLRECALELTQYQTDIATRKYQLVSVKASTLAYSALMISLESLGVDDKVFSRVGRMLAKVLQIDCKSDHVVNVQNLLYESTAQQPVEDGAITRSPQKLCTALKETSSRRTSAEYSPRSISALR
jgi:hypothetical protein